MNNQNYMSYEKVRDIASDIIHKSTCQFFVVKNDMPKNHGTGVCFKVNDNHFILTAAHVVEGYENEIFLKFKTGMFIPFFDLNINKISGERKNDKVDMAILKLTNETVEHLDDYYIFLSPDDLGINHELISATEYLAYGYPSSMTKVLFKKRAIVDTANYFTTSPSDDNLYEKLECKKDKNIIVGYNKKKLVNVKTNQLGTGPDVYGMSGCGLWHIPSQPLSDNPQKKLIAILTEWPIKDRKHIISTRIDVFSEIIRQLYNLPLPTSNIYFTDLTLENLDDK